jgi:hypothetical protein
LRYADPCEARAQARAIAPRWISLPMCLIAIVADRHARHRLQFAFNVVESVTTFSAFRE